MGCAHHFRPTYPNFLHGAPPTPACAAFIKESRMKFDNARKLDRKSGVRWCERGAPVDSLSTRLELVSGQSSAVVSHISRKTSEMWGTLGFVVECTSLVLSWNILFGFVVEPAPVSLRNLLFGFVLKLLSGL